MKKLLLNLVALLITVTSFAQAVTTQEEYDYLTKGYPEALEKGLDIKKGYELKPVINLDIENFTFNFQAFIKKETNTIQAYLITATKNKSNKKKNKQEFLCMPIGATSVIDNYVSEKNKLGVSMAYYYDSAESLFIATILSQLQHKVSLKNQ